MMSGGRGYVRGFLCATDGEVYINFEAFRPARQRVQVA